MSIIQTNYKKPRSTEKTNRLPQAAQSSDIGQNSSPLSVSPVVKTLGMPRLETFLCLSANLIAL
jgi:hypothetical protein